MPNYDNMPPEFYQDPNMISIPPQLNDPRDGATSLNQNSDFMKWILDFNKSVLVPLKYQWEGREFDVKNDKWGEKPPYESNMAIMNDKGINRCITFLHSQVNSIFSLTNYDYEDYNKMMNFMRRTVKVIANDLFTNYQEYGIKKPTDIDRIEYEIESKIFSNMVNSKDGNLQKYLGRQYRINETITKNPYMQQNGGMMSKIPGIGGLFR